MINMRNIHILFKPLQKTVDAFGDLVAAVGQELLEAGHFPETKIRWNQLGGKRVLSPFGNNFVLKVDFWLFV